jgi:hypothetical protein
VEMSRVWAMPNKNTFRVKPIGAFVEKYLKNSKVSLDPFARNSNLATFTNDLNPETSAQYHLYALEFLAKCRKDEIKPDLVIFDPPYSLVQTKRSYEDVGKEFTKYDSQYAARWTHEKEILAEIMPKNSIFLHFGWHSNGMGKKHGFEVVEILLVAHGGAHNDTICTAEIRT